MRRESVSLKTTIFTFVTFLIFLLQIPETMNLHSESRVLKGVAVNDQVAVYSEKDVNSQPLKSYSQGSILMFQGNKDENWFDAVVFVQGEKKEGFIHKKDVELITDNPSRISGFAKNRTQVYVKPSKDSKTWKSYPDGKRLYYETFTSEWHRATVYVNGERKIGYIAVSDVEEPVSHQVNRSGFAVSHTASVYASPTKSSQVLKSYEPGKRLYYKTFLSNWYEAMVYVNGERRTGYIPVSDVEEPTSQPVQLSGIAVADRTAVYTQPSNDSEPLKSYRAGKKLFYQTYLGDWYRAIVYVDGKRHTGFIAKSDVEEPVPEPENKRGIALKGKTKVYESPSQSSSILKSYQPGHILYYKTFISDWYEAVVYLNGEPRKGYIYARDVESISEVQKNVKGISYNTRTHVYTVFCNRKVHKIAKKNTQLCQPIFTLL
ncbi:hypothetical protein EDD68_1167 [Melghiribacillus thermohalophilus]|uniref:SH3 domain-containing protein n=1 Tax=Melghiribacillus thermohalophilus TaxID=1324956 RepID=A0A4R3MZW3_9BACI|nr:hypothetical protein [Melghiribacillus thermohalophilus]TCT19879.1 hypothetical protein EDD68_1167 [Melghiribacillus thermohalophilus]